MLVGDGAPAATMQLAKHKQNRLSASKNYIVPYVYYLHH